MEASKVYRLRSDVRYRILFSEAVVIRQSNPEVLVLNEWGARVLELVASGVTVGGVIDAMQQEYEVDRGQLEKDVALFLQELRDAEVVDADAP